MLTAAYIAVGLETVWIPRINLEQSSVFFFLLLLFSQTYLNSVEKLPRLFKHLN